MSPWLAANRPARSRINAREEHKQDQDGHGHGEKASWAGVCEDHRGWALNLRSE